MILFLSRIHWQCSPEYALAGPRLALWPGVSLTLVAYSLNMFGDAARDLLDPRPRGGRGKSSGARVIFLFAGTDIPVFLLTIFAKNEKANLAPKERALLIAAAKRIAADYRRRK